MKKLLIAFVFLFGMTQANAQGIVGGAHVGLPVGDTSDNSSFELGADVAYLAPLSVSSSVGALLGFSHYFTDEGDGLSFLPIAATGRINLHESFFLGADLGYALGLTDNVDGGFYYRPKVGFSFMGVGLVASYSGISVNDVTVSSVNLGIEFGL